MLGVGLVGSLVGLTQRWLEGRESECREGCWLAAIFRYGAVGHRAFGCP